MLFLPNRSCSAQQMDVPWEVIRLLSCSCFLTKPAQSELSSLEHTSSGH